MNLYIFILLCFLIYRCKQIHEWNRTNGVETHRELQLVNSIENGQFLDFIKQLQTPANYTVFHESSFRYQTLRPIFDLQPGDNLLEKMERQGY